MLFFILNIRHFSVEHYRTFLSLQFIKNPGSSTSNSQGYSQLEVKTSRKRPRTKVYIPYNKFLQKELHYCQTELTSP